MVNHTTFVHRYKWSHDRKRKRYRKLLKQGKVTVVSSNKDGWVYQEKEGM